MSNRQWYVRVALRTTGYALWYGDPRGSWPDSSRCVRVVRSRRRAVRLANRYNRQGRVVEMLGELVPLGVER